MPTLRDYFDMSRFYRALGIAFAYSFHYDMIFHDDVSHVDNHYLPANRHKDYSHGNAQPVFFS
jgi:hypothetical protein